MAPILVHIALIAYAAGAAAFLSWLVRPRPVLARVGRLLLLVGVIVHFAAFAASLGVAGAGLGVSAWKGGQLFSLLAAVTVAGIPPPRLQVRAAGRGRVRRSVHGRGDGSRAPGGLGLAGHRS